MPLLWQDWVLGAVCVDNPKRDSSFTNEDLRLLQTVAHYASMAVASRQLHDGTIDKFVGDEILAVFGSPEPDTGQHENAVRLSQVT